VSAIFATVPSVRGIAGKRVSPRKEAFFSLAPGARRLPAQERHALHALKPQVVRGEQFPLKIFSHFSTSSGTS
jgi:hypothetical protein